MYFVAICSVFFGVYFLIGLQYTSDSLYLTIGGIQFALSIYYFIRIYGYMLKPIKKAKVVLSKMERMQFPGDTTRMFRYVFKIADQKYYSVGRKHVAGSFKEYKKGDIIKVIVVDEKNKEVMTYSEFYSTIFISVFFFFISLLMLAKQM